MSKSLKIAAFLCAVMMVLASCGGKTEQTQTAQSGEGKEANKELKLLFPQMIEREGEILAGGTLVCGLVGDTPWKGIFNTFLYEDNPTYEAMLPMLANFMVDGPNHEIREGYCAMTFDREKKTATYHINPGLTWSDGVPVTAEDIIFCYECIGHPDYTGVRYDSRYANVVGMVDYHEGKAKNISGVKKIDDKTVEVAFIEYEPGILWGSGITYNAEPYHYLKDIPLTEMASHDRVRKTPLSCGPFVINSMVEGDIIEYVPNPYWYGKKIALDKLIMKRIAPTSLAAALKAGEVDIVDYFRADLYDQFVVLDDEGRTVFDENGKPKLKVDNLDFICNVDNAYGYLGFKFGVWNKEKGECEMFPDGGKFKDKALRQALGYAMDNDGINDIYYHGLRFTANSFITPYHPGFYDINRKGYSYNPEKAKQLLDEAGYKDVDGDGYRETPDGKPLKINFLYMSGSDVAAPIANYYIQNWKDVGLNVALNDGRLIEFNAFYDRLRNDDPAVEMYMAAWGVGSNPRPNGLYGREAQFNRLRWVNEKNDELLAKISSEDSFDEAFRAQAYKEWDENILEEAPAVPTAYRIRLCAVNKRVKNWDIRFVRDWDWCDAALVSDKPAVNTMK